LVFVTGANSSHFLSLIQLLCSIRRFCRNWPSLNGTIIWDLGLTKEQQTFLTEYFTEFLIQRFDFESYPSWVNIELEAGHYAWKPICIFKTMTLLGEESEVLIWLDAGNMLTKAPDSLLDVVKKISLYSPISDGNVAKWTHPKVLEHFKIQPNSPILGAPNRNGAILGFDTGCEFIRDFVKSFKNFALDRDAIAPIGSGRHNHRQDQALFTIMYYQLKVIHKLQSVSGYVDLVIHCDVDEKLGLSNFVFTKP
jgi:hypothetical protein